MSIDQKAMEIMWADTDPATKDEYREQARYLYGDEES